MHELLPFALLSIRFRFHPCCFPVILVFYQGQHSRMVLILLAQHTRVPGAVLYMICLAYYTTLGRCIVLNGLLYTETPVFIFW